MSIVVNGVLSNLIAGALVLIPEATYQVHFPFGPKPFCPSHLFEADELALSLLYQLPEHQVVPPF